MAFGVEGPWGALCSGPTVKHYSDGGLCLTEWKSGLISLSQFVHYLIHSWIKEHREPFIWLSHPLTLSLSPSHPLPFYFNPVLSLVFLFSTLSLSLSPSLYFYLSLSFYLPLSPSISLPLSLFLVLLTLSSPLISLWLLLPSDGYVLPSTPSPFLSFSSSLQFIYCYNTTTSSTSTTPSSCTALCTTWRPGATAVVPPSPPVALVS